MWTNKESGEPEVPNYLVDDYWTTVLKNIDNFDDATGLIKGDPALIAKQPKGDVDPGIELLLRRQEQKNEAQGPGGEECLTCMCCICC